jgi:hypothetical protein
VKAIDSSPSASHFRGRVAQMSVPIRLASKRQLAAAQRRGYQRRMARVRPRRRRLDDPRREAEERYAPSHAAVAAHPRRSRRDPRAAFGMAVPVAERQRHGGQSVDHAMHQSRAALGIGDATLHDLRRTAASHMTSIGVSRLIMPKPLNCAELA